VVLRNATIRPIDIHYLGRDLNAGLPEYQWEILTTVLWLRKYFGHFFCVHVTTDLTVQFSSSSENTKHFLFFKTSRTALGLTQAPVHWGSAFFTGGEAAGK
jgi:hypothetical protein